MMKIMSLIWVEDKSIGFMNEEEDEVIE